MKHSEKRKIANRMGGFNSPEWINRRNAIAERVSRKHKEAHERAVKRHNTNDQII
jgi:hypothetical protein